MTTEIQSFVLLSMEEEEGTAAQNRAYSKANGADFWLYFTGVGIDGAHYLSATNRRRYDICIKRVLNKQKTHVFSRSVPSHLLHPLNPHRVCFTQPYGTPFAHEVLKVNSRQS